MLKQALRLHKPARAVLHRQQSSGRSQNLSFRRHQRTGRRIAACIHAQNSSHSFSASFLLMVPSTPLTNGQDSSPEYLRVNSTASLMATAAGKPVYCISKTAKRMIDKSTRDRRASVHPRRQEEISLSICSACSFTPADNGVDILAVFFAGT